jgi:hypothetical protein
VDIGIAINAERSITVAGITLVIHPSPDEGDNDAQVIKNCSFAEYQLEHQFTDHEPSAADYFRGYEDGYKDAEFNASKQPAASDLAIAEAYRCGYESGKSEVETKSFPPIELCGCGHAKAEHERSDKGWCMEEFSCPCESFAARTECANDGYLKCEQCGNGVYVTHQDYKSQLAAERTRREEAIELIKQFRQWDHLDNAGDGPYWKRTIDAFLAADTRDMELKEKL